MKVFEFKCRFCEENLSYKRFSNFCAVYICRSGKCVIDKKNRYSIEISLQDFSIISEVILFKHPDYSKKHKVFNNLSINYNRKKFGLNRLLNASCDEYCFRSDNGNLNINQVQEIKSFDELETYISKLLLLK